MSPPTSAMSDKLKITGLRKTYGAVTALDDVSLTMRQGEFLTLLGPSGSGKSTLLWAVAGLNAPDRGTIALDGVDVTNTPPHDRDLGMVFQNYALFPHMTVAENIAFPLRMRGVGSRQIDEAVAKVLDTVQLAHVGARPPSALSGGQQQRIALARAMVYQPSIILMDEPLGALDKKLRDRLQLEIKGLHERLGVTILYVTHDQEEAMVMSDRICLMNHAKIEQIGTPEELYRRPKSLFAAEFLGESVLLAGLYDAATSTVTLQDGAQDGAQNRASVSLGGHALDRPSGPVTLMTRPDAIAFVPPQEAPDTALRVTVTSVVLAGALTKLFAETASGLAVQSNCLTGSGAGVYEPGTELAVTFDPASCVLLEANHLASYGDG
ncbi:MAG: ABC transporter ATP-binding protein [Devosiaceae bacterium]|nr:ABC transporter ATP-binding protein [Devosiaceae bacterium MH13]